MCVCVCYMQVTAAFDANPATHQVYKDGDRWDVINGSAVDQVGGVWCVCVCVVYLYVCLLNM